MSARMTRSATWRAASAALLWLASALAGAGAAPLRVASGFDPQTMDPHALALLYQSRIYTQVYDSLLNRDSSRLRAVAGPVLAGDQRDDLALKLRPGVSFHDGSAFTADDVVFSIERAPGRPRSARSS